MTYRAVLKTILARNVASEYPPSNIPTEYRVPGEYGSVKAALAASRRYFKDLSKKNKLARKAKVVWVEFYRKDSKYVFIRSSWESIREPVKKPKRRRK